MADAIAFGEKLLALLDQGRFTATYKYAVLLGLVDLCLEGVTARGRAPESVTTRQLAEKVVELYWSHTLPFGDAGAAVLRQNRGGRAEILTLIAELRADHVHDVSAPLGKARRIAPAAYERLVRDVEWKLVEMPLPRLQCFGAAEERFIYQIDWDKDIRLSEFRDPARFSNVIRFIGPAGDHLVRLAGLLRPLLQRRWAADVARLNSLTDAQLEEHLFGVQRTALHPLRAPLRELQDDRCFYCDGRLRRPHVDHFIAWARVPLNAIENLVVADQDCNEHKKDHLASADHVERWARRLAARRTELLAIADRVGWDAGAERQRTLGIARAVYLRLPASARLWREARVFVPAEPERLAQALAG